MKTDKKGPKLLTHVYGKHTFSIFENGQGGITICDYLTWTPYGSIPNMKIPILPPVESEDMADKEFGVFEKIVNNYIRENILSQSSN